MRRAIAVPVLPALLLGCVAGPNYAPPPPPAAKALTEGAFLRGGKETATAAPVARWWDALGDPQLSALIDRGLRDSPSIAAATARVRQARADLASVRASARPGIDASALYAKAKLPADSLGGSSGDIDLFNLGFDAQWEVDLWGAKRRDVERSRAEAEASAAKMADAQVGLAAEIARTYVTLRAREADLKLLDERHALDDRAVAIAQDRFAGGTAARQGVETAQAQRERTEAEQASTGAEAGALRDSLAVLTGQAPGALDGLPPATVPLPPAGVAVGDPAALLARRPDIRAAERLLAARNAQIGVEAAHRFPQVSLLGLIGIGGTSAGDLFDTSQLSTIALPRLSWSFLDFGRTRAAVRRAEAGRDAALADYRASVLGALQDAEAALARYGAARTAFARSGERLGHSEEVARLDEMRAQGGTLAPGDAIDRRREAVDAAIALVDARANLTLAYVALTKALGLGWGEQPVEQSRRAQIHPTVTPAEYR